MTIEQLKDLLKRYQLKPNETFGQNFLLNDFVLQDMVDSVPRQPGDAILEIGPGIGNLTSRLLDTSAFVLSIEKDKRFLPILKSLKKAHKNFQYEIADALRFNFEDALADYPRYHVVANIPYYITGKIIQLLLLAKHKPITITILIQKEVAQNAVALAGRNNLLSLSIQLYGSAKILQTVPARDFFPIPKVTSSILQIHLEGESKIKDLDSKKFFRLVRSCFAGKRKQIHNTLTNNYGLEKDVVLKLLDTIEVKPQARPQELSLGQWIALYKNLVASKSLQKDDKYAIL
jgi:16S rRNA (adenine1518-N6/adenine1519-N6)-dimethyltransferase